MRKIKVTIISQRERDYVMKLISRAIKSIGDMKVKNKLVGSYIIVVLIPIIIVGIYMTNSMKNLIMNKTIAEASINIGRIQDRLGEIIKVANDVSNKIYFSEKLKKVATRKYFTVAEAVSVYRSKAVFDEYLQYYKEIASIRFYVDNKTMADDSQYIKATDEIKNEPWYVAASVGNGDITWAYRYDEVDKKYYLSLVRLVKYDYTKRLGVLVINISEDKLNQIIKDEPFESMIAVNDGVVVMSKNADRIGSKVDIVSKETLRSNIKEYVIKAKYYGRKSDILINSFTPERAPDNHFQIFMIMPLVSVINTTNGIILRGFSIIAMSLILSMCLIIVFSRSFSERIILLRKEMRKVVSGNFNIKENIQGKDEIGELYDDLYKMMHSIKHLIEEVYIERIQKEQLNNRQREVEFKMLASQINPHFLYNTLETIRMKAYCNGEKEIANIVKMLGKIMRRNLEVSDKLVSLDSEVELVKNYLEIQKLRFGDKISYNIDVQCDVSKYEILPLLLQPIVENAFVHGLESKETGGMINILIYEQDNYLNIGITDNGLGISNEKLKNIDKLLSDYKSSDKKSIGLSNVNQRIKLFYGEKYGLNISSRLNEGTKITISLPSCEVKN